MPGLKRAAQAASASSTTLLLVGLQQLHVGIVKGLSGVKGLFEPNCCVALNVVLLSKSTLMTPSS